MSLTQSCARRRLLTCKGLSNAGSLTCLALLLAAYFLVDAVLTTSALLC